jgi:hypothetical protein
MGWWEQRRAAKAARARYERFVDQVPAGFALLCGRIVGADVPQELVRQHIERDCTPRSTGGPCCVNLRRR